MTPFMILFFAGAVAAVLALGYVAFGRGRPGSALAAAIVGGAFAGFTAIVVYREGPLGFLANHTVNGWGTQVWYDLVIALVVALVFVAPRARAAGMNVPLYAIATGLTGSIGLLAMVARLFWLEHRAAGENGVPDVVATDRPVTAATADPAANSAI